MDFPKTGGKLQQFLCAMQGIPSSIPQFQWLMETLQTFFEIVYDNVGKHSRRSVAWVSLANIGWKPALTSACINCKKVIVHRVTLAYRDEAKWLCTYTDVSDFQWSGIIKEVSDDQSLAPHPEQDHNPLGSHSSCFSTKKTGWFTLSKEALPVLAPTERLHGLATCSEGFHIFTDHNNMIFLFHPIEIIPDIGQAALHKVLRWAVRIFAYNYVCTHIHGE